MMSKKTVATAIALIICALLFWLVSTIAYAQEVDGEDDSTVIAAWEHLPLQLEAVGFRIEAWTMECLWCCGYLGNSQWGVSGITSFSFPPINRPGRNNVINIPYDIMDTSFFNDILGGMWPSNWNEWADHWAGQMVPLPLYQLTSFGQWSVNYRMFSGDTGNTITYSASGHYLMRCYRCCETEVQIGPFGEYGGLGLRGFRWSDDEIVFRFYFERVPMPEPELPTLYKYVDTFSPFPQYQDLVRYTIEVRNPSEIHVSHPEFWFYANDFVVEDILPQGLTLVEDSVTVVGARDAMYVLDTNNNTVRVTFNLPQPGWCWETLDYRHYGLVTISFYAMVEDIRDCLTITNEASLKGRNRHGWYEVDLIAYTSFQAGWDCIERDPGLELPITKILRMPNGTFSPDATFSFNVTFVSSDFDHAGWIPGVYPQWTVDDTVVFEPEPQPSDAGASWGLYDIATLNFDHLVWPGPPGYFTFRVTENHNSGLSGNSNYIKLYDYTGYYITVRVGWVCGGVNFNVLGVLEHQSTAGIVPQTHTAANIIQAARTVLAPLAALIQIR